MTLPSFSDPQTVTMTGPNPATTDRIAHRLQPTPFVIVDYDPVWPTLYALLKARIEAALPAPTLVSVSHIGSTSVPGMAAKPIIDIDLVVADIHDEGAYVTALAGEGWETDGGGRSGAGLRFLFREPGWFDHRFFVLEGEPCFANVHVFGPGSPRLRESQLFKEWLIEHPKDREVYAQTKRFAIEETKEASEGMVEYTHRKGPVIMEILDRASKAQLEGLQ